MKHPSSRWSCRLARGWASLSGTADAHTGWVARHVSGCADCQRAFAGQVELETMLRREARQREEAPLPGLESRILREITRTTTAAEAQSDRRRPRPLLIGTAVAAGLVLLVVVARRPFPSSGDAPPDTANQPLALAPDGAVATASTPSDQSWSALTAPVQSALGDDPDPLQSEADLIAADARSAVRFLALNFLPSNTVATSNGG